jgi:hypothetical protein
VQLDGWRVMHPPTLLWLISFPGKDQYPSTYFEVKQALTMPKSGYTPLSTRPNTPFMGQN